MSEVGLSKELGKDKSIDKVDLINIIKIIFQKRFFVIKVAFIFVIFGLFIAIFSKNEYKSSTVFTITKESKAGGGLGNLASLAGINFSAANSDNQIPSTLYPKVIYSTPFLYELINTPISFAGFDKKISFKDYYLNFYDPSLLQLFKKYTLGLPGVIIELFGSEKDSSSLIKSNGKITVSNIDLKLLNVLKSKISININHNERFVDISAIMPDPVASAELTKITQELLQDYIIKFKIQKSKEELSFIEKQFNVKKKEFNEKQKILAEYKDNNQDLNSVRANSKLMKLQSEYDIIYNVFLNLSKQVETQKLNVKKNTPVFIVLEPALVPNKKNNPKKSLVVLTWGFLGVLLSVVFVFCKIYYEKIKDNFTS